MRISLFFVATVLAFLFSLSPTKDKLIGTFNHETDYSHLPNNISSLPLPPSLPVVVNHYSEERGQNLALVQSLPIKIISSKINDGTLYEETRKHTAQLLNEKYFSF